MTPGATEGPKDVSYERREEKQFYHERYDERVCSNAGRYRGVGFPGKVGSKQTPVKEK